MMDFIVENYLGFIEGALIVYLWTLAHDRRKAVDRLVRCIEAMAALPPGTPRTISDSLALKCRVSLAGGPLPEQDTVGRVIARSVKRMTKEN